MSLIARLSCEASALRDLTLLIVSMRKQDPDMEDEETGEELGSCKRCRNKHDIPHSVGRVH